MAVDPEQIEAITRATLQLYRAAEADLLQLVTRSLEKGLDSPAWMTDRLSAVGNLRLAVQDLLRQLGDQAATEILQALAEAYREGTDAALTELPEDVATRLGAAEATTVVTRTAAVESLASALVSDVGAKHSNVLRDVLDIYRKVISEATASSIAGGLTRRQAAQQAYARFVDRGVVGFTDVRGRRWRLSSYVEMGLRTVTQRAAIQGQTDKQTRLGLPFVMVSNEAQECERCRPYEGRVLRIGSGPVGRVEATNPATGERAMVQVKATLESARSAGFQHPNCRHSVRAFLPGVTKLPPQPTADPKGDDARQRQRAIERAIRRWKEREAAALDPAGAASARARVRLWQGQMRDHLAANPSLKRLSYREQIGAGNLPSR